MREIRSHLSSMVLLHPGFPLTNSPNNISHHLQINCVNSIWECRTNADGQLRLGSMNQSILSLRLCLLAQLLGLLTTVLKKRQARRIPLQMTVVPSEEHFNMEGKDGHDVLATSAECQR